MRNLVVFSTHNQLYVTFQTLKRTAQVFNRGFYGIYEFSEDYVKLGRRFSASFHLCDCNPILCQISFRTVMQNTFVEQSVIRRFWARKSPVVMCSVLTIHFRIRSVSNTYLSFCTGCPKKAFLWALSFIYFCSILLLYTMHTLMSYYLMLNQI